MYVLSVKLWQVFEVICLCNYRCEWNGCSRRNCEGFKVILIEGGCKCHLLLCKLLANIYFLPPIS